MKKILLLSTFQQGAYAHFIEKAFMEMDYLVYRFDHRTERQEHTIHKTLDQRFQDFAKALQPDILFTIKGRGINPKIIEQIPAHKVLWWLDNATRFVDFLDYAEVYDKYYLIEEGQDHPWMPIGIDPDVHKPTLDSHDMFKSDAVFVGTAHAERSMRILKILRHLPCEVAIWGNAWLPNPLLRGEAMYFENLMKIYTMSKLILNNHYIPGTTPNMRTIEAPASGNAMISDTGNGINQCLKPGIEYIPYNSIKEARYLIMKYLEEDEERRKIAKAGYEKVYKDFLLKDILKEMIK